MKRFILLTAAVIITLSANAQMSNMQWGIKAGLNLATLTNSDYAAIDEGSPFTIDSKMKPSFYVGVFAEFPINWWLGIQPEVVFSRQGTRYKDSYGDIDYKAWVRYENLNIPIMFKFYVLERLSIDVGPQFGFVLGSKFKEKFSGADGDIDNELDGDFDAKTFDFSIGMGASYKFWDRMDVSIRYNLGLTETRDFNDGDKWKNSVLQLGLGYRF